MDALKRIMKFLPENAFEQKKKNPGLKFNLRLALYNRPSNNWTLGFIAFDVRRTHPNLLGVLCHKAVIFFSLCARVIRVRFEQLTDRFELISIRTLRDLQSILWTNKQFSNMNSKLL